jgi:hypothetical protein
MITCTKWYLKVIRKTNMLYRLSFLPPTVEEAEPLSKLSLAEQSNIHHVVSYPLWTSTYIYI